MAKLRAPLFSLEARGQLGKALVYFPWKGVDAVRTYTVPANPRTTDQTTQRGYLEDSVDEWHGAAYSADDITAWNRLAGIAEKIMSGFNRMVREYVNEAILGSTWTRMSGVLVDGIASTSFTVHVDKIAGDPAPTVRWGTRKTHFPNSLAMIDDGDGTWSRGISGLTAYTLYYFYIDVGTTATDWGRTGIYQQRTTA